MLDRDEPVSKRPDDGAFFQQRLPAWKPVINIHTTIPVFAVIGLVMIPIGLLLITTTGSVKEARVDYSRCGDCETKPSGEECICSIEFELSSKFTGRAFHMYYGLEKYYQNHRKYATSRSDKQLRGYPLYRDDNCEPFESDVDTDQYFAPCGLIANSMFNDTFQLEWVSKTDSDGTVIEMNKEINFTREGIAWPSDHGIKFRNPMGADLVSAFNGTTKPPDWRKYAYELDPQNPSNNAFLNEPFIVWMRVAAFPTFRKLYGRVSLELNPELDGGLEEGKYRLTIDYNYPVLYYHSKKFFVLSSTSIFGGRNLMLGVVYLVVGILLLLLATVFACVVKKDLKSCFGS